MINKPTQCFCYLFVALAAFAGDTAGQSISQPTTAPAAAAAVSEFSSAQGRQQGQLGRLQIAHRVELAYPPLARIARIQGDVTINFKIGPEGAPESLVSLGHPLLVGASLDNLTSTRFASPPNGFNQGQTYVAAYVYTLSEDSAKQSYPAANEIRLGDFWLEVDVWEYDGPLAEHCPSTTPPPAISTPQDSVELSHSSCHGTCPIYTLDVLADGEIRWKGISGVHAIGEIRSKISPKQARALIERFRTQEFWSSCGSYSPPPGPGLTVMPDLSDHATVEVRLQLGSDGKAVSDHDYAAPSWMRDLEEAIDKTAHAERWIGKPKRLRGLQ